MAALWVHRPLDHHRWVITVFHQKKYLQIFAKSVLWEIFAKSVLWITFNVKSVDTIMLKVCQKSSHMTWIVCKRIKLILQSCVAGGCREYKLIIWETNQKRAREGMKVGFCESFHSFAFKLYSLLIENFDHHEGKEKFLFAFWLFGEARFFACLLGAWFFCLPSRG